jgi:lipopolysaccharide transport system permease protein
VPYPLFVLAGLLPWQFFATSINSSGTSIVNTPSLITKVYFPRLVIPLSAIGAPTLDFLVSTVLMALLSLWYGMTPSVQILWLPALLLLAATAALGVGSLIAALAVSYRDFRHLLPFLVMAWMYLTPVIYPPSVLPEWVRTWLYLNPMAGVVDGMRSAWFGTPMPVEGLVLSCAMAALLFVCGVSYFRTVEKNFADLI